MKFSESLKKTRDFSIVYQRGRSVANRTLVLYVLRKKGADTNRVGISVSKKVGNSVVRHRLTRLVRESYRLHELEFDRGLDLIVLVRPGAKESVVHSQIPEASLSAQDHPVSLLSDLQQLRPAGN